MELRLSQAIDEALKNNPEIHFFRNKLESARVASLTVPFSVAPLYVRHADDLMEE